MDHDTFVNECVYNKEVLKESLDAWWKKKFKIFRILVFLLILYGVLFFCFKRNFSSFLLLLFTFLPLIVFLLKKKIAISNEKE